MVLGQDSESSYRVAVDLQQRQGHTRFAWEQAPIMMRETQKSAAKVVTAAAT